MDELKAKDGSDLHDPGKPSIQELPPKDEPVEELSEAEKRVYLASQWRLMGRRFRRHKLAVAATAVLAAIYLLVLFCEFFSPYDPNLRAVERIYVPPQRIRFFDEDKKFHLRPFVFGIEQQINMETFRKTYTVDKTVRYPVSFFVRGDPYKLWGLFPSRLHFIGTARSEGRLYLLGTDNMGRDMLSRIIFGARISMTIGLVGVAISFFLGMLVGGISGYVGGTTDNIIQRIIEVFRSFPSIPLWMALSAAVPSHWPQLRVYFSITIILSLIGWVTLARVVRGKFLALREEDYVMAAKTSGSSQLRIIWRHMIPSFTSHIIAALSLSIPGMILGETSLSFLGIGLRPPLISWGVLLQEAQNARTIALHPWLLIPCLFVIVAILAFNFLGDGLRDAADPYNN